LKRSIEKRGKDLYPDNMGKQPMFSFGKRHHQLDDFSLLLEPSNLFLFGVFPFPEEIRKNIQWNLGVLLNRKGYTIRSISIDLDRYTNLVFIKVNDQEFIFDDYYLFLEMRFEKVKKIGKYGNIFKLLVNDEYRVDMTFVIMD
jgi:hypothetical protein